MTVEKLAELMNKKEAMFLVEPIPELKEICDSLDPLLYYMMYHDNIQQLIENKLQSSIFNYLSLCYDDECKSFKYDHLFLEHDNMLNACSADGAGDLAALYPNEYTQTIKASDLNIGHSATNELHNLLSATGR